MKTVKHKGWRLLYPDSLGESKVKDYFDTVQNSKFTEIAILKHDHRSIVRRIALEEKDLVLKKPVEKNSKPWIRFTTLFRSGESFRNMLAMSKLWNAGIKTTVPVMAAEFRKNGMVVDSWLLYEYLDGKSCLDQTESFEKVVNTLKAMHAKDYLHGDPQIRNFIDKNGEIYVIDSSSTKPGVTPYDTNYELAYLRRSQPEIESYFGNINSSSWYRFARWYDLTMRKWKRWKRRNL